MSLQVQFWTLALMLMSGLGLGAAFDGCRVVSHRLGLGRMWLPVLDLLYWLAATLAVFRVLTAGNEGEVRLFVFVGLLLGVACYFWLFSRMVIRLVEGLIAAVKLTIRLLLRTLDLLLLKPLLLLWRMVRSILGFLLVIAMFLFRFVLHLIRPFWLVFRWLTAPLTKRLRGWAAAQPVIGRMKRMTKRWITFLIGRWTKWF